MSYSSEILARSQRPYARLSDRRRTSLEEFLTRQRFPILLVVLTTAFLASGCSGEDGATPAAESPAVPDVEAQIEPTTGTESTAPPASTPDPSSSVQPDASAPETADPTRPAAPAPIPPWPEDLPEPPAPPEGIRELIPGHNRLDADRINLILSPWGFDDLEYFGPLAETFVAWDGRAQLVGDDALPAADGDFPLLGLFVFEPFRSNRHLFNVWVTELAPPGPALWLNTEDDPFDLPDQVIVTLALDPDREVPGISSVAGQDDAFFGVGPEGVPGRTGTDPFANVMIEVETDFVPGAAIVVVHELGHAMFGLSDEYVGRQGGDVAERADNWPSCAASLESAEAWWGDAIGTYDPMIDVWAAELASIGFQYGLDDLDWYRDQGRTAFVESGCYGVEGSYRSAEDTMLGFNFPAFGVTNRRWAEQILSLWSGDVT